MLNLRFNGFTAKYSTKFQLKETLYLAGMNRQRMLYTEMIQFWLSG